MTDGTTYGLVAEYIVAIALVAGARSLMSSLESGRVLTAVLVVTVGAGILATLSAGSYFTTPQGGDHALGFSIWTNLFFLGAIVYLVCALDVRQREKRKRARASGGS